eukprot:m.28861 g.28861  ORF g.28861 m.28861 type:complete len:325 (-) comp11942_c0_seq1:205-1179(-)
MSSVVPYRLDDEPPEECEVLESPADEIPGQKGVHNVHLFTLPVDHLYHIGYHSAQDLVSMFGDIKLVCMGGSATRMRLFSSLVAKTLNIVPPLGQDLVDISTTDRYSLFKIGPVLCCNHGMGTPSASIILHEIAKLLFYAGSSGAPFVRIGTSGGLGCAPGTTVISDQVFNGLLEPYYELATLGKCCKYEARLDEKLSQQLLECAPEQARAVRGNTMCCNDFYEGQARLDGAICTYTEEEKLEFLQKANKMGIVNIEMEGLVFASFCRRLRIPGALICVALLNRLHGDQITNDHKLLEDYQMQPQLVVLEYIKKYIMPKKEHEI